MDTLYKEEILDHYKNPQNFGKLDTFDTSSKQTNPLCGDEIEIYLKWEKGEGGEKGYESDKGDKGNRGYIGDVSFLGRGCAISIASTSILTEFVKNKSKEELTKITEEDMLALLGIEVSESRKKCALLGLYTVRDCLG